MQLSLRLGPEPGPVWELARQTGVEHGVLNLPNAEGDERPWEYGPLRRMNERVEAAGLSIEVIEERPPMTDVILGREGRDEQIGYVKTLLENMGRLDIPVYCWEWMPPPKVVRTGTATIRGGARGTAYNDTQYPSYLEGNPVARELRAITEEELWENLQYFLDEVVPVAEEADVKLALHPDDPPHSPLGDGEVERIITSPEAYDRVLEVHESEYNGVCLGQGNFSAMGADVPAAIRHFGGRIHFSHFRDVRGEPDDFYETWHDNGQTDMRAAIEAYRDVGFEGPIRPDHFPEVTAGDGDGHFKGRLFAVGYMRGLMEQTRTA